MNKVATLSAFALCLGASATAASTLAPPALTLQTMAGLQAGAQGSYCVGDDKQSICADSIQPHPDKVSIVRPGGHLSLRPSEGRLSSVSASFGALGCDGVGSSTQVRLHNGAWRVTAPARSGAYELQVFTRFKTETAKGDTSMAFGVVVSRSKVRRIVPAAHYAVC